MDTDHMIGVGTKLVVTKLCGVPEIPGQPGTDYYLVAVDQDGNQWRMEPEFSDLDG